MVENHGRNTGKMLGCLTRNFKKHEFFHLAATLQKGMKVFWPKENVGNS
jgi:hypothetical protein